MEGILGGKQIKLECKSSFAFLGLPSLSDRSLEKLGWR
jgi:hypothetical protein